MIQSPIEHLNGAPQPFIQPQVKSLLSMVQVFDKQSAEAHTPAIKTTSSPMTQATQASLLSFNSVASFKDIQLKLLEASNNLNEQAHTTANAFMQKMAMTVDDFKPLLQSALCRRAFIAQPITENITPVQYQIYDLARSCAKKQGLKPFDSLQMMDMVTRFTQSYKELTQTLELFLEQSNQKAKPQQETLEQGARLNDAKSQLHNPTTKQAIRKINGALSLLKLESRLCKTSRSSLGRGSLGNPMSKSIRDLLNQASSPIVLSTTSPRLHEHPLPSIREQDETAREGL